MKAQHILFAHSGGGQSAAGEGSYDLVTSLRSALGKDFEIHFPLIENPEAPTYDMWKTMFDKELPGIPGPLILTGHSLGGSMLLKYLSEEQPMVSIAGVFLIGTPVWDRQRWDVKEFALKEHFETTLPHIPSIHLYHSIRDNVVPFGHLSFYRNVFEDAVVHELEGSDHVFANGLPQLVKDIKMLRAQG